MIDNYYNEEERAEITRLYKKLLKNTYQNISEEELIFIRKALDLALDAHKSQRRKSGEPYIYHPIEVARIVAEDIGLGAMGIACALLHDVVEDSDYTLKDMESIFNPKVAKIIDGLTKIAIIKKSDVSVQAENYRKLLITLSDDVRVILIKLADRLHNMRTMIFMPAHKQKRIASETLFIYAPLAHKLGLHKIKSELEDLGLKYTQPQKYRYIEDKINKSKENRDVYINTFISSIRQIVNTELGIEYEIYGRLKSIYSIHKKLEKQKIGFNQIFDKYAIRIVYKPEDENYEHFTAWKLFSIITRHFTYNESRTRNWLSNPRATGYEALHTTVMGTEGKWIEIQIRSERMHDIAEKGIAAHYFYKQGKKESEVKRKEEFGIEQWIDQMKEVLENKEINTSEFIDNVKMNLYEKEVFCFTPKGKLYKLPKGATILDFAYAIHSRLGDTCIGAKIGGKLASLSHEISSGDQIEILSSKNQKPKLAWIDMVITSRAKSKIKATLNQNKKVVALYGKELLLRKLRHLKVNFNPKIETALIKYFKQKSSQDVFYMAGIGSLSNQQIKDFVTETQGGFLSAFRKFRRKSIEPKTSVQPANVLDAKNTKVVFGSNEEKLNYTIAKCCSPVAGDPIFGFTTINQGVKLHKQDCPNAVAMRAQNGYRILEAQWRNTTDTYFIVQLKLTGTDGDGILVQVAKVSSKLKNIGIKNINLNADDVGLFNGIVSFKVNDKKQLNELIKELNKIENIYKVERI